MKKSTIRKLRKTRRFTVAAAGMLIILATMTAYTAAKADTEPKKEVHTA